MVQTPLLEPLISGMLRMIGSRRRRLLTVIPKGWGLVFRDLCEPRVGASDYDSIEIVFDDVSVEIRPHPAYFTMWEGVCPGILDLTQSGGSLDCELAPDHSCFRAVFSC
jgi:hypothetical protein